MNVIILTLCRRKATGGESKEGGVTVSQNMQHYSDGIFKNMNLRSIKLGLAKTENTSRSDECSWSNHDFYFVFSCTVTAVIQTRFVRLTCFFFLQ